MASFASQIPDVRCEINIPEDAAQMFNRMAEKMEIRGARMAKR